MYDKPHRTYLEQLDLLRSRGLTCSDENAALRILKAVGYYRLSAYVYPFRLLLPEGAVRVSPVHYRASDLRPGVTVDDVEALWSFDRKLRLICLDAIETIEIGLRTRLAHVLGARNTFGHLDRGSLNPDACRQVMRDKDGRECEAFDVWMRKYKTMLSDAKNEDYVVHHRARHPDDDRIPVWIAVEFFDLGALSRLFGLLDKTDQNAIAKDVGVSGGPLLGAWMRDINYLRNLCAHHSRLWNRSLTYKARKFNPTQVGEELRHVATSEPRDKVYVLLAVVSYLVLRIDPSQRWPESALRTHVRKFPLDIGLSPERDMGFPPGWADLPLWRRVPSLAG